MFQRLDKGTWHDPTDAHPIRFALDLPPFRGTMRAVNAVVVTFLPPAARRGPGSAIGPLESAP